jgi:hypothetical protein
MLGAIVVSVLAAIVCAVWFLEPNNTFQGAANGPSNSTAPKADQSSGESAAAKNNTVLPEKSATGGGGQSSSGEAAQIEQSATPLQVSEAQRQKIQSYFSDKQSQRLQTADFTVSIGAAVPQGVELRKLPTEVVSAIGGYQGDDYVLVGSQLVIVDANARRVVAIVPDVG